MIYMGDVAADPDMADPESWAVLRSTGSWQPGGFVSTTVSLCAWGPVRVASNREIAMLPEADRVGSVRAFYWTRAIYLTRNTAPVPSVAGGTPAGDVPGTVYTLAAPPPGGQVSFYKNGLLLSPNVDYTLSGATVTLMAATQDGDALWYQWPVTANSAPAASDIIEYQGAEHRVLQVYRVAGSGYWKALATRMTAA